MGAPTLANSSGTTGHKPGSIRPTDSGFLKLALVKSKLHSTVGQQRLYKALLLASVEKDILLELDDAELVAPFASKSDRQIMQD